MNRTCRSILAIFALASLLGGTACTVLPEAESLTIYQLPAPTLEPSSAKPLPLSLRIGTPQAGSVLSSPRMIVNPRGNELQTYKGARWSDPVPALLREHLARAFEQRGVLEAVSTDENTFRADIHLSTDLRRFQVIYADSKPTAVIELKASLIDPTSRAIMARRSFTIEQILASPQIPGVVDGFKLASDEIASQVIDWTVGQLESGTKPPLH
jgi:cholesterol transport system auxiliary component